MECKKIKCKDIVFKIGLCKKHFYNRKMVYRYQGHLSQIKNEEIKRKILLGKIPKIPEGFYSKKLINLID